MIVRNGSSLVSFCGGRTWIRRGTVALMAATIGTASGLAALARADAQGGAVADQIKRGDYLVNAVGGCNDCHTPKREGPNGPEDVPGRFLAGHDEAMPVPSAPVLKAPWMASVTGSFTAWSGPWGVSFTRNLTPDRETGLGDWTEQQFVDTMRKGRRQGHGRELLPPMPWMVYKAMTDDDLKAIYAYLRTIPSVKNKVPEPVMAGGNQ